MRRNRLWEPVPWDDLVPENSVEASASLMMEDVPVGKVVVYLSRRTLDEELSAKARRELVRVAALAVVPCIAMAQLLWQLAVRRTTHRSSFEEHGDAPSAPLHVPPNWSNDDARLAYLDACRAFIRNRHASATLLCRLAAREDWGELRATARDLREAALALNAGSLAAAALSIQEAALAHTASASRHVENCIPTLAQVQTAIIQILRDNAVSSQGENA